MTMINEDRLVLIIAIAALILLASVTITFLALLYQIAKGDLDLNCDTIVYSTNWTLEKLRNITRICSNGG
jgi:hypothetical protein